MSRRIMLVAGEPSGDALGGPLMAALRGQLGDDVSFLGIGGEAMGGQGLESLFPMSDLSIMGLAEVLPRIPLIRRRLAQAEALALKVRPDALVTIDAPGFNFRLARRLAGQGILLIHYVAPTVWSWRPGRAREIAAFLDHLLAILPFEPPYFDVEGLPCTFVGHTAVSAPPGDGAAFRRAHDIAPDAVVLGILPGSRLGEVKRHAPVFTEVVNQLGAEIGNLHAVCLTVTPVADEAAKALAGVRTPLSMVSSAEKADAFAAMNAALAASGTVTLELSLAGTPCVAVYRMNPITMAIIRRLAKSKAMSLTNLILEEAIIPEFIQARCRPEYLVPAVKQALFDDSVRARQIRASREVAEALGAFGRPPAERAAQVVAQVMAKGPRRALKN
jgi:lipid-A-disaccharide synthase